MAQYTYGIDQLNAAQPGLSRLAAALAGAGDVRQSAENQQLQLRSRLAQEMASARASEAQAAEATARAAEANAKVGVLNRRPGLYEEQSANAAGVDVPTVQGYRTQLRTGQAPLVPMGPPTEDGTMGTGSLVLPDATRSRIAAALQQFAPLVTNSGDLSPEQMARAAGIFRESDLSDRIINGSLDRNRVAGAQAAVAGKPLYNQNETGAVLDQFGGALDASGPLAKSTIGLRNAQAGEASAKAALVRAQVPSADGTVGGVSPAALDAAAARYNVDGTLPPLGLGKDGASLRRMVLNRAAELATGTDPTAQRVNQLDAGAARSALGQLSKSQAMSAAFEQTANANANLALGLSKLNDRTGVPMLNAGLQAWRTGSGSPEATQFAAANETFVNEYAKIMSGGMGNGPVSDAARSKAHDLLTTSMTPAQYEGNVKLLQTEMANRMKGFEDQSASLRARIGGKQVPSGVPPAPGAAPAAVGAGMFRITHVDGKPQ
jgi:hypothetical protein